MEESLGLNLYEMDLRQYDPAIARWTGIDPVTHYSNSTYNAFDNNPVFYADPSGADSIYNFDTNEYVINGTVVSQDEAVAYANNGGNSDGSNNNTSEECCGAKSYVAGKFHVQGPKEKRYYRNHGKQETAVKVAAYNAGSLASKMSDTFGGGNLDYSGALRHSYWMYLVAVELGPELAEKLGILHEDYIIDRNPDGTGGRNNMESDDSIMDVANNAWGINMARKNSNLSALDFEEAFFNDVKSQNTTIMILDQRMMPKESQKAKQVKIDNIYKNARETSKKTYRTKRG